jgi:uncharacterized protein YigA (DUF484 family)
MSSNQVRGLQTETVDEGAVAHYLQHNSDFFERHPQLLARLRLQHPRNGSTVSLIERQVEVLREKYQALEQKLSEFMRVARGNNLVADKIHRFTRRLIRSSNRAQLMTEVESGLREDFDAVHAVLVLADQAAADETVAPRLVRHVSSQDPAYRSFDTLFSLGKPRCGQIRDSQLEFLFGSEAQNIGSVALMPLGEPPIGLLALGSVDRDRFHPGMSTEFLSRMSELITDALARG